MLWFYDLSKRRWRSLLAIVQMKSAANLILLLWYIAYIYIYIYALFYSHSLSMVTGASVTGLSSLSFSMLSITSTNISVASVCMGQSVCFRSFPTAVGSG